MTFDPKRIQKIFLAACEADDLSARNSILDRECRDDAKLRASVEELLRAHDRSGGFLAETGAGDAGDPRRIRAAGATTAMDATSGARGRLIAGRYKLLELIGEGGMGAVWMAEQREPVKRLVAIKLIKPGMDSRDVVARFEAERQALALMDHPNIARILDGGMTAEGRPYFAMELVKGLPITDYCDSTQLPMARRLELFAQVCSAVQHAHQKGILHRDLKPSNVLVTEHDGVPVPKVIDFGLAKAMHAGQSLTDRTLHTGFGAVVGTPLYMAPEQVGINSVDVDTRADVYALGATLYELIAGSPPLEKRTFQEAAWNEVVRLIREQDPPRPSLRLSSSASLPSIAARRGAEPARLNRLVRGDLDWIVMKALEKDRARRYETADGLARDLRRYLADEAVEARPPSRAYLVSKFVRRHRAASILAATAALCLVAAVAGTTFGMIRAESQRVAAEIARDDESKQRSLAVARREEADRERRRAERATADAVIARDDALAARNDARRQLVRADLSAARTQSDAGRPDAALHWLVKAWKEDLATNPSADERRDADENHRIRVGNALEEMPRLVGFCLHDRPVLDASCDAEGRRVVSRTGEHVAYLWDAARGEARAELRHDSKVEFAEISPDGERIVTGAVDGTLRLWDANDGSAIRSWTAGGVVRAGSLSPDGARIAVATDRGGAVYSLDNLPDPVARFAPDRSIDYAGFDPTGERIATASLEGKEARVWDAASGEALGPPLRFDRPALDLPAVELAYALENRSWPSFSPSGKSATSFDHESVDIWTLEGGVKTHRVNFGTSRPRIDVSFVSDETAIVATRGVATGIRVIDLPTGAIHERPKLTFRQPSGVRAIPLGGLVLVPITGGVVEAFRFPSLEKTGREIRCAGSISVLRTSASGERTLAASTDGSIRIYESLATAASVRAYSGHCGAADRLTIPGVRRNASGTVSLVAVPGGCELRRDDRESGDLLEHPDAAPIRLSTDGSLAVTASPTSARIWTLDSPPRLSRTIDLVGVSWAAFGDDGERVALQAFEKGRFAAPDADSTFSAWNLRAFARSFEASVARADFPDANATLTLLASGQHSTRALPVWNAATGESLAFRPVRTGHVYGVAFGPGDRLAVPISDGTIQQIDPRTETLVGPTIQMSPYTAKRVAYSPDGKFLACVSSVDRIEMREDAIPVGSRVVHLLDSNSGEVLLRREFEMIPNLYAGPAVWFSADGRRLILHGDHVDWTRECDIPRYEGDVETLELVARLLTSATSDDFGAMSPLPENELIERREEYLQAWRGSRGGQSP